jgi:hypothetical protein
MFSRCYYYFLPSSSPTRAVAEKEEPNPALRYLSHAAEHNYTESVGGGRSVGGGVEDEGSDDTIGETGEQLLAEGIPGEGSALGVLGLSGVLVLDDGFSLDNADGSLGLTHEVVDLNTLIGADGDPLELGVEGDLVDGGTSVELARGEGEVEDIPDEEFFILATGGEVLAVGGDREGVHVGLVGLEGVSDLEVGVPNLESAIPAD